VIERSADGGTQILERDAPVERRRDSIPEPSGHREIARLAAASAMLLLGRRVMITAASAVSTAIVARQIGVGSFGLLAAAQGVVLLVGGLADFGFSIVLARDLATSPAHRGATLGASIRVASATGLLSALVVVAVAAPSGFASERGVVLLVLCPSLLLSGVGTVRQSYMVLYRTKRLAVIDLATNLAQAALTMLVARAGGGVYGVAITISGGAIANPLLVGLFGRRLIRAGRPGRDQMLGFLRAALPLGLASFLSSVYFTVDLVLLGWLVSRPALGEYAAAVKVLNLLVQIPGFVMNAVLPGLSRLRDDREALSELAARVWHWLMTLGLPACVAGAVFAPTIINVAFGGRYAGAVPMFQVLSAAAALALVSNVLGVLLNSVGIARAQVLQNSVALVFNVVGNILLAPRFGPIASAWLTVATELIVDVGSILALRGRVDPRRAFAVSTKPLLACAVLAAIGVALGATPELAIPVALAAFVLVLVLLGGWPAELSMALPGRRGRV